MNGLLQYFAGIIVTGILFGAVIFGIALLMMAVAILIDTVRVKLRKGRNNAAPQI